MTLIRVVHNKNNPYLTINTSIASDDRISWRAKGLWFYAFSKTDDWNFFLKDLIKRSTEGRDAVRKALKELQTFGYLHRKVKQDKNGRLQGFEWYFFETPKTKDEIDKYLHRPPEKPSDGKTVRRENRPTENRPLVINKDTDTTEEKESNDMSAADAADVNNSLFQNLKKKNPKFKIKSKKAWERNSKKLLRQYSKEEVLDLIEWTFTADHKKAEFWRDVVQSPESLYNNIDKIIIQRKHRTKAEVEKEKAQEELKLIEDNRDWAQKTLSGINFSHDRYMRCQENSVEIKNGGEFIPIGYKQKNLKQIVEHKLRSWELL